MNLFHLAASKEQCNFFCKDSAKTVGFYYLLEWTFMITLCKNNLKCVIHALLQVVCNELNSPVIACFKCHQSATLRWQGEKSMHWPDLLRCVWSLLNGLWFWRSNSVRHCVCKVRNTSMRTSSRIAGPAWTHTHTHTWSLDNGGAVRQVVVRQTQSACISTHTTPPSLLYRARVCPAGWWGCEMAWDRAWGRSPLRRHGPCPAKSPPSPVKRQRQTHASITVNITDRCSHELFLQSAGKKQ